MKKYLKLIRIKHYLKNGLIFLPLIFSKSLFNMDLLIKVLISFFIFSIASSIVYIVNDIRDVEKDKNHPKKKKRPIASGEISIRKASIFICILTILLIGLIVLNTLLFNVNLYSLLLLTIYILINIGYSFGMKNVPILDIVILVSGFLIRVLYGSVVSGIEISSWLYLTVISMSFYLGLGKRRNEIVKGTENGTIRKVLKYYNKDFLDKNMYMYLALTATFYSLWCLDNQAIKGIIWTIPVLLIICMKYSLTIESESNGDPIEVLLSDKVLMFLCSIYLVMILLMIYI